MADNWTTNPIVNLRDRVTALEAAIKPDALKAALAERNASSVALYHARAERDEARNELAQAARDRDAAIAKSDKYQLELQRVRAEGDEVRAERDRLRLHHAQICGRPLPEELAKAQEALAEALHSRDQFRQWHGEASVQLRAAHAREAAARAALDGREAAK